MEPWLCPCCQRANEPWQEICLCGESHRDEKKHPVEVKPMRGDSLAGPIVVLIVGLLGVLACAYTIARTVWP